jgi:hypothetical protein
MRLPIASADQRLKDLISSYIYNCVFHTMKVISSAPLIKSGTVASLFKGAKKIGTGKGL